MGVIAPPIMKTAFLVRHAKSGHDDCSSRDRAGPLTDRGERDASMTAKPDLGELAATSTAQGGWKD